MLLGSSSITNERVIINCCLEYSLRIYLESYSTMNLNGSEQNHILYFFYPNIIRMLLLLNISEMKSSDKKY